MTWKSAVCILFVLVLGCQPAVKKSEGQASEPAKLESVSFFTDDNGKAGTEVSKFDFKQKTLHFRATLSRPLKGEHGKWIFTAKSTSAGNNQAIQALDGTFDGSDIIAEITLKNPWPVGTYHVDIVVEDQPLGGFDFEVTGEKSALAFLGHSLAPDDGKGLPAQPVTSFKPTDRTVHIQVTTKGVDTTEPEVVWRLFRVANGKDLELGNTVQPKTKLQDSVLKCQFTSPKDWQAGDYRADIFVGGKRVHSIAFKVQ